MMYSMFEYVCWRTLSIASRMNGPWFSEGVTIVTNGWSFKPMTKPTYEMNTLHMDTVDPFRRVDLQSVQRSPIGTGSYRRAYAN